MTKFTPSDVFITNAVNQLVRKVWGSVLPVNKTENYCKNTTDTHLKGWLIKTMMNSHGALKSAATTSSVTIRIKNTSPASAASQNSVSIAEWTGIKELPVKKNDYKEMLITLMRSFKNLLKGKSINSAPVASFGFQKTKDVIT